MAADDVLGEDHQVFEVKIAPIEISLGTPIAADGYQSKTAGLFALSFVVGPSICGTRYVLTGLRRCDAAHRQLERVRHGIAALKAEGVIRPGANQLTAPAGSDRTDITTVMTAVLAVIDDLHMAMAALHRAVQMADKLPGRFGQPVTLPKTPRLVKQYAPITNLIRDACEHIDERALGQVKGKAPKSGETPLSIFDSMTIFTLETISYSGRSFDINREATDLLLAIRDYLFEAWAPLVNYENQVNRNAQ